MPKRLLFFVLLLCLCLPPVFSSGAYLTEAEYLELLNIIKTSEANSREQTRLIAELRKTLAEQEAELLRALRALEESKAELRQASDTLNQSDGGLTELRNTLSRIRSYSDGLAEYCAALENENGRLKTENRALKISAGISGGAAGVLAIVLLILFL
jgi:septal ring factor EnvC (AmiA/AmiB activator)